MVSFRSLTLLLAGLASGLYAKSSTGDTVLVIVEPKKRAEYSLFFGGLKGGQALLICEKKKKTVINRDAQNEGTS